MVFEKGSHVLCINDKFPQWVYHVYQQLPVKGKCYVIRSSGMGIIPNAFGKNDEGKLITTDVEEEFSVLLEGVFNNKDPFCKYDEEPGFISSRFAPVQTIRVEETEEIDEYIPWSPEKEKEYEKIHEKEYVEK